MTQRTFIEFIEIFVRVGCSSNCFMFKVCSKKISSQECGIVYCKCIELYDKIMDEYGLKR